MTETWTSCAHVGELPPLMQDTPTLRAPCDLSAGRTKSNRAAIGARVTITGGGMAQFNEVRGGGSYCHRTTFEFILDSRYDQPGNGNDSLAKRKCGNAEQLAADAIYTVPKAKASRNTQKYKAMK